MSELKAQVAVNVEVDVRARARAAVAALRGTEHAIAGGMSGLVNQALIREARRLERAHHGGEPFPQVDGLTPGRTGV